MTRAMVVGMGEAPDESLRDGPGETIGVMTTGDAIAGATIDIVKRVGGYVTTAGRTTTGAIGGTTIGGAIDATVAIDLYGVLRFGIASGKLSQLRDMVPVP